MWITKEIIKNSKNTIFVFGDNLEKRGLGGQAKVCRPFVKEGKAIGIPTKRKPSMTNDSFFNDRKDEFDAVKESILYITDKILKGYTVIFLDNIGKGRAKLPIKSPMIYSLITEFIEFIKNLKSE